MHWRKKKKLQEKEKMKEKIKSYFEKADEVPSNNIELADIYIHKARNLAMKYQVRIKSIYKRKFCSHCYAYCRQGINCRVRLSKEKVVLYCFACKKYSRYGYRKEKSVK